MQDRSDASVEPTPEQVRYAGVLEKGMYAGLVCLLVTFTLYASGIVRPYIARDELPKRWDKPVHEYLEEANIDAGWGWVTMLGYGDFLNFLGIALLAGVTIFCYLAIVPLLIRKRDYVYAVLALLEVVVLVVAASGIRVSGGH